MRALLGTVIRKGQASPIVLEQIPAELGAGEREAVALATEHSAALVILDDLQGQRVAQERGLRCTGTVGVLVEAKARQLIPSLRPELERLRKAGIWLSEAFYKRLLELDND